jgi:hypothetical protein
MPDVTKTKDDYDVPHLQNIDSELDVARVAVRQVIAGMTATGLPHLTITGDVDRALEAISTFCKNARRAMRDSFRTPDDEEVPPQTVSKVGDGVLKGRKASNGTR